MSYENTQDLPHVPNPMDNFRTGLHSSLRAGVKTGLAIGLLTKL